jgi:ABC-2 type transport system ATP-binding protein
MDSGTSYPDVAVSFCGVTKDFPDGSGGWKRVLHGIDLEVGRGSIYGLLGPNGAGKSTMINMMSGLVNPGGGKIEVWGMDVEEEPLSTRAVVGVMGQEVNFDPFFTPYEVLETQAGLNGLSKGFRRTDEILRQIHLWEERFRYSRWLSGGMKRRLMLGKAIVSDPPILVLDEPTAGVDVELRKEMWDYVEVMRERGVTIILTTHYLEEAEALCDRVAIINKGRKIADAETSGLLKNFGVKEMEVVLRNREEDVGKVLSGMAYDWDFLPQGVAEQRIAESARVLIRDVGGDGFSDLWCCLGGLCVEDVTTREVGLEEIFLRRIYEDRGRVEGKAD